MENSALDEIEKLGELLDIEKEEDYQQYLSYIKNAPLEQRKAKGLTWYPLSIKEKGYGLGDYPYVIVERREPLTSHQFGSGQMVNFFSNVENALQETSGVINFVNKATMKVTFYANDHPEWIDDGRLGVDHMYDERSYKEMRIALKKVAEATRDRLAELREIILGYKTPSFSQKAPIRLPELNDSQNEAVNTIISAHDLAVVHGPPGTGKTTTLVAAIRQLAKTEKNILVCAPSNAAADLLVIKIAEQGVPVVRIGNIARVDSQVQEYTIEGKLNLMPEMKDLKKMRKQADELRRMALKYKRKFGREEREQRNLLMKEAKMIISDAIATEDALIAKAIGESRVVVSTLVGASHRYIRDIQFSTAIIDECAQALEPAAWIPITRADRVVLAGDPYQLPPTVKSNKASQLGLSRTLLEKCIERHDNICLLNVQYRMNAPIMGFSNDWFYEGKLQAHSSVISHMLGQNSEGAAVIFIDTAGCSYDEKIDPQSHSTYNEGEATTLFTHLAQTLETENDNSFSVGIISPYRAQVVYLQDILNEQGLPEGLDITVNTIDSFQGQERDAIYISLVRSNEDGEIGFLKDYRRMNVAMTRARKKLVVIGDSATLGQDKFYQKFLSYVEAKGLYRTAWEFMAV